MKMVRTTRDGKLSLTDLVSELYGITGQTANYHIRNLIKRGIVAIHERVPLGGSQQTYIVTEEEWATIKPHVQQCVPSILYALQYSNVWDCVKIGRCRDIHERLRVIGKGHNCKLKLIASYPDQGYLEQRVHKRLESFRSLDGLSTEWYNIPGSYALKVVDEVIQQSRQESLSSSESEQ